MAASAAGRGIKYYTFNDSKLADELTRMHKLIVDWQVQVGKYVYLLFSQLQCNFMN